MELAFLKRCLFFNLFPQNFSFLPEKEDRQIPSGEAVILQKV